MNIWLRDPSGVNSDVVRGTMAQQSASTTHPGELVCAGATAAQIGL